MFTHKATRWQHLQDTPPNPLGNPDPISLAGSVYSRTPRNNRLTFCLDTSSLEPTTIWLQDGTTDLFVPFSSFWSWLVRMVLSRSFFLQRKSCPSPRSRVPVWWHMEMPLWGLSLPRKHCLSFLQCFFNYKINRFWNIYTHTCHALLQFTLSFISTFPYQYKYQSDSA